ncbi:HNH endonuclease family protein [Cellulomonas fimi]|uniref:HNH endonuclease family protein n=1 Tax=Cellulomonas fimi TaxID=1708 RepID=UPI00234CDFEA|nr:HNH endonuclease family protein [Cellulomonas fimi]MDC7123061.1 HNH endonuclease family protein [Cellulomonas fimi]
MSTRADPVLATLTAAVRAARRHLRARRTSLWVLVLTVAIGTGVPAWTQARSSARYPVLAQDLAVAHAVLDELEVRTRPPPQPYDRAAFGQAWADVDRNGCDTRNDVLRRDLDDPVTKTGTRGCLVLSGVLDDPYTGRRLVFERGPSSADVQVDHVVALGDAWVAGAAGWSGTARTAFANDPANLLAVEGGANQDKGADDASRWLPPNVGYRCAYAVRQVLVKSAYRLSVTRDERRALAHALDGCVTS